MTFAEGSEPAGSGEAVLGEPTDQLIRQGLHTHGVDEEPPPICPACGVTMVPAALSAFETRDEVWICLECEERDDPDVA